MAAVDVELELRHVVQAVGPHLRQRRVLRGHAQQLVARRHQRSWPTPPRSSSSRSKPVALPSSKRGRRRERDTPGRRVTLRRQLLKHALATPATLLASPGRSVQSFRSQKARPAFWPWPTKLKPATVKSAGDVGLLVDQEVIAHLRHHRCGLLGGGAGRQRAPG